MDENAELRRQSRRVQVSILVLETRISSAQGVRKQTYTYKRALATKRVALVAGVGVGTPE